jgi:hypothetical protein
LMAGVISESAYATVAVRPVLKDHLSPEREQRADVEMTYHELFWFHLPLAGTSVLALLAQPLVTSSLARLQNPTISLAAWPIVFQITLMSRAAALAWPEAVIALTDGRQTFLPIRRFTLTIAAVLTALMALFVFSPLSALYIFVIQDMTRLVGDLAQNSLSLFLLFPALTVFTSWLRGLLIGERVTKEINVGMALNLAVTGIVLLLGISLQLPGLPAATAALNIAALCEVIYLAWRTNKVLAPDIHLLSRRHALTP